MGKLPVRLDNDPIVEALVEFRFIPKEGVSVADLLPGMLYSKFMEDYPHLENLSESMLPTQIRAGNPSFIFKPLKRLRGENFIISIGDQMLSIGCSRPYVGWEIFSPRIKSLTEFLSSTGFISKVTRFSVKYVNLIPSNDDSDVLGSLKASVQLGEYDLAKIGCSIRSEINDEDFLNIVQVVPGASLQTDGGMIEGLLLDIDTIWEHDIDDFWNNFDELIIKARASEKNLFFQLLTEETLNACDPVWE